MSTADELLSGFVFDPRLAWWEAERHVPCWGDTLPVQIAAPAGGPSPRQVAVVRAALTFPGDLRAAAEPALFEYYKREVEGTTGYVEGGVDVTAQRAPQLQNPSEVWGLLHDFRIYIPSLREGRSEIILELHAECSWDEDHGLCVLFRDWQAALVAGQMDCRGESA